MANEEIRWEQRFSNYQKALVKLTEAVEYIKNPDNDNKNSRQFRVLNEIVKEGLIQRFKYTYEMAWNVMKDYALFQGNTEIAGSRDAIRYAFASSLIENGEIWMEMIKSRIKTSHTYDEETADDIFEKILNHYLDAFQAFEAVMKSKIH